MLPDPGEKIHAPAAVARDSPASEISIGTYRNWYMRASGNLWSHRSGGFQMNEVHRVRHLYRRTAEGVPVEQVETIQILEQGVVGDHGFGGKRHVTILFEEDWNLGSRQLGLVLDPAGRRSNVFVTGAGGEAWIGRSVRLGSAILEIRGLVLPCHVMDEVHPGLREALLPDGRGGIWAHVIEPGFARIGDSLISM
jgi:MOSC domain-containing protein YiiM